MRAATAGVTPGSLARSLSLAEFRSSFGLLRMPSLRPWPMALASLFIAEVASAVLRRSASGSCLTLQLKQPFSRKQAARTIIARNRIDSWMIAAPFACAVLLPPVSHPDRYRQYLAVH